MSASLRFSVTYVCDHCGTTAQGVDYESPVLGGMAVPQIPLPSRPDGWVFVRADLSEEHYCGARCARAAVLPRWDATTSPETTDADAP